MYQHIAYQHSPQGLVTITLQRPEVFNALNNAIKKELKEAFDAAGNDDNVRVVVLTGAGKAFCSGQDLKAAQAEMQGTYADAIRTYYNPLIISMRELNKPIICRLNGIAAGAGCSLALACDIIVASEEASLSELFVGIGLVMDSGSTYFLPRLVGSQQAFELATTGRRISAQEAYRLGMLNQVVPATQLDEAVQQYVNQYLQAPTVAVGLIKKLLNHSYHHSLESLLELEAVYQNMAAATQDHKEGIQAFLEKRPARFQGR